MARMNKLAENESNLVIENIPIRNATLIYRAINNKTRQELLRRINAKKKMTVTELYVSMGLEQPVVSNHLAILRRTGVVLTERAGKCTYYSIDHTNLLRLHALSASLLDLVRTKEPANQLA
jgi:DNA-binding transcriptional ArsR family regulator